MYLCSVNVEDLSFNNCIISADSLNISGIKAVHACPKHIC